jgi:murein DD-endopeptidase MepM/ murein hydrolase activator NlpD
MFKTGKALLAVALAGSVVLGLQVPAHAKTAESDTRLAVANTVNESHIFSTVSQLAALTVTVTVVKGDTLSGLAVRYCGNGTWSGIYNDNLSVVGGNPNLIFPGQRLVINCATGAAAPAPAAAAAPAVSSSGWVHPVPGLCYPWDANGFHTSSRPGHEGVDLPGGRGGQAIHAAAAGTVTTAWQSGAGNYSVISHGNGVWSVYMHQSSYAVRSGYVDAGTVIGYVGATGDASGPHLHFEIHLGGLWNGHQVDPVAFMSARGVRLGC